MKFLIQLWKDYKHFRNDGYSIVASIQFAWDYRMFGSDEIDEDDLDNHWLCVCEHYIENGCHCPHCHHEPPWGCPCDWCQSERYYDENDYREYFDYLEY